MVVGSGFARMFLRLLTISIVAPIAIAAVLLSTVDENAFKVQIIEQIAKHMGADVQIVGPVDIDWGWPPSIVLSGVQLANTGSFGVDIITIDRLETELDVFSLATGQLQPSHLRLKGVDIVMRPDALLASAAGLEASIAPAAGPLAAAAPAFGLSSVGTALGAAGVSIAGASVTLMDPSNGSAATVDIVGDDTDLQLGDGSGGGGGDGSGGDGSGGDGSGGDGSGGGDGC